MVRRLNVDGDAQGDTAGHGGEHRAVFVYQTGSYEYWATYFSRGDFLSGQFGENFTVDDMSDDDVCIGDRYRIGGALFEVTQPRVTCYRVGIRMGDMAALLVAHGRPGFYFRVLEEGEVEAGDDIVKVASGPERMSVSEIDALLYKPGHPLDRIERALRIPALSPGWQRSFRALLAEKRDNPTTGNAGLAGRGGPPPSWSGFRPFRVTSRVRESEDVITLVLETSKGQSAPPAQAGQYVVLRLQPASAPALMRCYSLSGEPGAPRYRVSIKRDGHGAASSYIHDVLKVGDMLDVSAPRGRFTLRPTDGPIDLMSAGIGATPVLSMLKALAAERSTRRIWWIYGARSASILLRRKRGRCSASLSTRTGTYATVPRVPGIDRTWISMPADASISMRTGRCRCRARLISTSAGLRTSRAISLLVSRRWACRRTIFIPSCSAPFRPLLQVLLPHRANDRMCLQALPAWGRSCRSAAVALPKGGIRASATCSKLPKLATSLCAGRVARVSATTAKPDSWRAAFATARARSSRRQTETS